ncbi:hypothetical protein [Psychroserpens ponticola]|uniref:Uncharacterized protein n=1 Tax=Psychroserpens ponticola TaxID=2932268 RepID=A0ABY7RW38_9FLAO|nr:hypothetical protein [Psychroserpens ponticola]WCO00977.1 hypothetical protein MUN68_012970 [Psychroserpens ponticola]
MKKLLTICLLISVSLSFAQDFSITKSDIFKDKKKNSFLTFSLEAEDGGIVTIRSYRAGLGFRLKGYYIQYFDSNLKLIKELDYEVKNKVIKNAFLKGNTLHLIEQEALKKEDKIGFSVASSELSSLNFTSKSILNFSEDNVKKYFGIAIFPFFFNGGLNQADGNHLGEVIFSANEKFFAINFDFKNKDQETHKVFVFNDNFEKVYEKLIVKDIKDKLFEYNSFEVDGKDGTIYFLGKAYENGKKTSKKGGKINYHFELSKINSEGEQITSFKSEEHYIESLHLLKNEERLVCVGFFGNKQEYKLNGVCVYDLNPETLETNFSKFNEFSDEFLNDKYGNREGKKKRKKEKGINNIDFKGVYLMANNDIVVNAEEFFITTTSYMDSNGNWKTRTVYHFNDIMAMRLDGEGNLKWARNINKAQVGTVNSSYTSLPVEESTYFFINCSDNVKKISADRIAFKQTSSKKSNLYVISIDKDGNFDYKKLIDDKESKVYYKVNGGVTNINNQSVFLLGERKRNGRILKLQIN